MPTNPFEPSFFADRRERFHERWSGGRHGSGSGGERRRHAGGGLFGRHGRFGGGHGFGHGMGGRGLRGARLVSSEDLQLMILSLLAEKPSHGYEIIKALEEKSSGIYTPSPGMIYPALTYLEELSFAVSATEGTKKLFSITEAGTEHLEAHREQVTLVMEQLKQYGERMAHFQEQMQQEETTEAQWGGSPKEQMKQEWRQMKSEFQELRHELKAALFEKLSAPLEEKQRILQILREAIDSIRNK